MNQPIILYTHFFLHALRGLHGKTILSKRTQFPDPTNLQFKIYNLKLQNEPNFKTLRIENHQSLDVSGRNDIISQK
jgi:hypothetical protein